MYGLEIIKASDNGIRGGTIYNQLTGLQDQGLIKRRLGSEELTDAKNRSAELGEEIRPRPRFRITRKGLNSLARRRVA